MQNLSVKTAYQLLFLIVLTLSISIDSVAQQRETRTDSILIESVPDSALQGVQLRSKWIKSPTAKRNAIRFAKIYRIYLQNERHVIEWDSVSTYTMRYRIGNNEVRQPYVMNFEEYVALRREEGKKENWQRLIEEGKAEQQQNRGLLDFKLNIPGGQNSAFTSIFGKPEVNLRVNGSANMNVGASIQKIEDPSLPPDLQTRIDPTFNQNLQLNIQGTIGDKLTIATDWDTERAFDFQNRLSIVYEGYEDEIIKRIEMGNVSMETGNSLVRGGAALFGIKSIAELGPLKVTSVISQQEGENNTQSITGGSQETEFSIRPAEYQNNRHFFIDFYNRQQFENNVSNPQQLGLAYQISDIKIWISEPQINTTDDEAVRAAAFTDLGVVQNPDNSYGLPDPLNDIINDDSLNNNRNNANASASTFGVSGSDYYNGYFRPLQEGVDYTINKVLGFFSLRRGISPGALLAVSFVYINPANGQPVQVGDIIPRSTGLTYFKLIRPNNLVPANKAWELTMRNVYSLGISNVTQEGLEVDIKFTRGNIEQSNLPGRDPPLLQDLGLDRTNTEGALRPDNIIDFTGIVLDPAIGTVLFPYLEPFGDRVAAILETEGATEEEIANLAFTELYDDNQYNADQSEKNSFYEIQGLSKGGATGSFTLGAILVEGSVKVFANGVELVEGVDYEVDYSFGIITILNDKFLVAGQDISVEYESNQFSIVGQKNFTGVRAEYTFTEDIKLGTTYFKLKEQPLSDKIRIGDEPINNTVLGADLKANFDAPWLTRFIDGIPLLQTREESNISISGEIAQLRPGVAQTNAIQDAIADNELFNDEENGLVFIDDFEGTELSIPFTNIIRWNLAAPPAAVPGYQPDQPFFDSSTFSPLNSIEAKKARADLRAQFSWYTIPRNISSILGNVRPTPESETVLIEEVFPGRETNNPQEEVINTMDVYYNPNERGPYNYNSRLRELLEQEPERAWGGMTATLPPGQEDLNQNNIEFLEFWVQPILPGGREPTAIDINDYDGKLYIELGTISEDVQPNFRLNSEDGLANNLNALEQDSFDDPRSYVPDIQPPPQGQFSNENRQFEDVGFDGVPSVNGFDQEKVEQFLFRDFIDSMRVAYGEGSDAFNKIQSDPSNDDYVYYAESKVQDFPVQERFYRMLGYHEGNTPVAGGEKRAVTLKPDTEGLINASNIEQNNSYYQYEIALNPADFSKLQIGSEGTFIVDKVPGERQQDRWHLVRVPLNEFKRVVGDIEGFQNIQYLRVWMTGYRKPFTLRFATFEFVGSQWRKVTTLSEAQGSSAEFRVSTINIEENANREPIPYRQPEGAIRAQNRGVQVQSLANEQSLVLEVDGLGPGEIQMIKRVYPGGLNLLNYSNMRMFVHGEGFENRGDAELVIRMGLDLENNYYEYRQPVTPSNPDFPFSTYSPDAGNNLEGDAEEVWLYDENSLNILLSAFNELKQLRDQQGITDITELFQIPLSQEKDRAVPGAVIGIKGNPSLGRVAEIGMGIKNPYNPNDVNSPGRPSLDAEMWLNELRVSGFDNQNGWAANAKASFKLADFATFNSNLTRQTEGFGGLDSRLGQRRVSDQIGYDLNSTVNLHKLIPDRYGWNFPVTVSKRRNELTPTFLPNQGDIRLDDFISATESNDNLSDDEKSQIINDKISEVQTIQESFSINLSNISKQNSRNKLAEYTLDKTRLSYVYNEASSRNPELLFQDSWGFNTALNYNLSFRNVRLLRPFKFTESVPVLKALAGIRLGYMPSSITASATMSRNYDEKRRRAQFDQDNQRIEQPLQQTHTFNQRTSFGLNYSLTPSIPLSYRSNTSFDLNRAGIEDINQSEVDSTAFRLRPTFDVIKGIVSDTLKGRRSQYDENFTASWRPRLNAIKGLNWLTYNASYSGGFSWTNSPQGSDLGAQVSNNLRLDNTFRINTGQIFSKIGFIQTLQESESGGARINTQRADSSGINIVDIFKNIGKKTLLALVSMESIDLNYNKIKGSTQAGYRGQSQIYYAFNSKADQSFAPPIGYRLGLTNELPRNQLISGAGNANTIQLPQNKNFSDNITAGTSINLFENVNIDLDWETRWDERQTESISLSPGGDISSVLTASGNISSSVWSFGSGYKKLFEKQLETAIQDYNGTDLISDETGNNDGRVVLNRRTLEEDFRDTFLTGNSSALGRKGFTPIPKPGWNLIWSGFEDVIPFLGKYMTRASLTHSYNGSYRLGWNLNPLAGEQQPQSVGAFNVIDVRGKYEPASINIEQSFSPLVQLNITWESALRTQFGYNRSKVSSLALSSKTLTERSSTGFNLTLNYSFREIRIPFFPKIKNNIDIALNGSIADDTEETFRLSEDLERALTADFVNKPEDEESDITSGQLTGQKRINGSIVISYRFSSTISSNFEYTYSKVTPKSSRFFPRTNHDIRFNFRIAIQSR